MSGKVLSESPRIVHIPKFLSKHELNHFLLLAEGQFKESTVIDNDSGQNVPHPHRTGELVMLSPGHDKVIATIEERVAGVTGTRQPQGEPFQVIKYGKDQTYKSHHDFFRDDIPGHLDARKSGGQRIHSVIIYLKCASEGGETKFPELGITHKPKPGDALVFTNVDTEGKPDFKTLHEGAPVVSGEKIIATRWIRERAFDGSEEAEAVKAKRDEAAKLHEQEKKATEEYQKQVAELRTKRENECFEEIKPILMKHRCRLVAVIDPQINPRTGVLTFNSGVDVRAV